MDVGFVEDLQSFLSIVFDVNCAFLVLEALFQFSKLGLCVEFVL